MPLHDWAALPGWDGVHHLWMGEILHHLKPRLPAGYRVYIGSSPTFAVGSAADGRPDISVREFLDSPSRSAEGTGPGAAGPDEPDMEVAVAGLATDRALLVERGGRLVAAVELVSPRNKDRASSKQGYAATYAGYLVRGVNLVLIDVHRLPQRFSFADEVAAELGTGGPPCPVPHAVAYRVGGPAPNGGRFLAVWRKGLAVGEPLPAIQLPLSVEESVALDLDCTYRRAAEAAYLD